MNSELSHLRVTDTVTLGEQVAPSRTCVRWGWGVLGELMGKYGTEGETRVSARCRQTQNADVLVRSARVARSRRAKTIQIQK